MEFKWEQSASDLSSLPISSWWQTTEEIYEIQHKEIEVAGEHVGSCINLNQE